MVAVVRGTIHPGTPVRPIVTTTIPTTLTTMLGFGVCCPSTPSNGVEKLQARVLLTVCAGACREGVQIHHPGLTTGI